MKFSKVKESKKLENHVQVIKYYLWPIWFRHDSFFVTHNSNSNLITNNPNPTITQKLQNCLVTKPSHISQLLSPFFAKMVEPTPLTLHRGYGCYPRPFSLPLKLRTHHCQHHQRPQNEKKISTKRKSNH